MPTHAAFLRGMNVGGHRITNEALKASFSALGHAEVQTFRASGNVILDLHHDAALDEVARSIEDGLAEALGYAVPVFLRTAAQMRAIAGHEPFPADAVAASGGKPQIALLAREPPAAARRTVLALATEADRLALHGSELYWLPSGGISGSELDLRAIDAALGPSTIRTKGTIDQIAARYFAG